MWLSLQTETPPILSNHQHRNTTTLLKLFGSIVSSPKKRNSSSQRAFLSVSLTYKSEVLSCQPVTNNKNTFGDYPMDFSWAVTNTP